MIVSHKTHLRCLSQVFQAMSSATDKDNIETITADPNAQKIASHPFNKHSADVILRTSDDIDFYVRKAILAEAAQVFDDMFSLPTFEPQENDGPETVNGLPVISITEDSVTLENFLRFAYPVEDPQMDSAVTIFRVFEATKKYMAGDIEVRVVKQLEACAALRPLPVYGLAAERGWREEMEFAAQCSLKYPLPDDFFVEEMENMTAGAYIRLQRYHRDCCKALQEEFIRIRQDLSWLFTSRPNLPFGCQCIRTRESEEIQFSTLLGGPYVVRCPTWWLDYYDGLMDSVRDAPQAAITLTAPEDLFNAIHLNKVVSCGNCSRTILPHLLHLNEVFTAHIAKVISKVRSQVLLALRNPI